MRQAFILAALLCMSSGAIANGTYTQALSDQDLAASVGGVAPAVTIDVRVDTSQPYILSGSLLGDFFGIKTTSLSNDAGSITQASASIAVRATLSEGGDRLPR